MKKQKIVTFTLLAMNLMYSVPVLAAENQEATANSAETPVSGSLGLSVDGGYDPNPPSDLNKKSNIKGSYYGISYYPETFNFGNVPLLDIVGKQTIIAKRESDKTFNIGVKDKRRARNNEWTLFAKLDKKIGYENEGIYLKMNNTGEAKINTNNGIEKFKESDLTEQLKLNKINEVATKKSTVINTSNRPIMYNNKGEFVNGVYDLELGDIELNFPNASKVSPQDINFNVQWTLENTPSKNDQLIEKLKDLFNNKDYTDLKTSINSQLLAEVEREIYRTTTGDQREQNLRHFEKYAKGHLIHWNSKNDKSQQIGSIKLITNGTNSRAGIIFENLISTSSNDSSQATITYKLERDGKIILEKSINDSNSEHQTAETEVQPGDILTIYHSDGIPNHVTNYPGGYIDDYMTSEGKELKYKITNNFQLEKVE